MTAIQTTVANHQTPGTELALRGDFELVMPVFSLAQAAERRNGLVNYIKSFLHKGTDYGVVPGTNDKPTLLKPGAEKLNTLFGLTPRPQIIERVEDWTGEAHGNEPFFYYLYRYQLYRGDPDRGGTLVAESDGSCNSWEKKYRYRWVSEADVPAHLDKSRLRKRSGGAREPVFAIEKAETGGKYGKPLEYWDRFNRAMADGTARKIMIEREGKRPMAWYEIPDTQYRVPNEDSPDVVNTLQKMAQKRALIGATLLAINASEFFTQDLEDMADILPAESTKQAAPADDDVAFQTNANGEADLSHANTFFSEWDRGMQARGVSAARGRAFLDKMLARNELRFEETSFEWRRERLERLDRGEFDKVIKPEASEPAAKAPASPAQQPAAKKTAQPQPQSPDPIDAATTPTLEDMADFNKFWVWFCDPLDQHTEAQVKAAVTKFAKRQKKTPETLNSETRLELVLAAQEGRFDVAAGEIVATPVPAGALV